MGRMSDIHIERWQDITDILYDNTLTENEQHEALSDLSLTHTELQEIDKEHWTGFLDEHMRWVYINIK